MLSRALSLATVMLWIGCCVAGEVHAQNLEAGKSPSQIFSGTCSACHKSARGLLRTVPAGSLPGFLREHYTTSRDMAAVMAGYLISNGAADTRYNGGGLTKQGQESRSGGPKPPDQAEPQPGRRPRPGQPQDAARPDADGLGGPVENRNRRRARQNQEIIPGTEGQPPVAAEEGAKGRAKQKLGKRNRPGRGEPAAKPEPVKDIVKDAVPQGEAKEAATPDPAGDPAKSESSKPDIAKPEATKPDVAKPSENHKPDVDKLETDKPDAGTSETPLRPDPVPQVTPAPKPSESLQKPPDAGPTTATPSPAPAATPESAPAAQPSPSAEPPPAIVKPMPVSPPPPQPPAPPSPPAGPPAPPISQ